MNLIIFEDHRADNFYPISVSHPIYDLFYGCFNVVERLNNRFKPDKIYLSCRESLAKLSSSRYGLPTNSFNGLKGESIIVNAAIKPDPDVFEKLKTSETGSLFYSGNDFIGGKIPEDIVGAIKSRDVFSEAARLPSGLQAREIEASLFKYLWDIVNFNMTAIKNDIALIPDLNDWKRTPHTARHGDDIYVHPKAAIHAGANLDISRGPIIIDEGARVESRSLIQGPAYIGKKSVAMSGMIREGCSIGPVCKVGGELEESIILGYSNKCHEGFIGHAYIGEWANLGALTTNSDLKNDYGTIKVSLQGQAIDTKSIKVGCFIGDHTKTGIGTLLNTGLVIGFCNNLYGGSLFTEKEIGHFKWGTPGNLVDYRLDKAMAVAKSAMSRRGCEFNNDLKALFEAISKM